MFATLAFTTLLASSALFARAAVNPLSPSPGDVFNEGSTCHIAWAVDTTGDWKTLNIELMTGDNIDMIHLTTVATVDGTTRSSFDYPCPDVTVNSAIYFYQFSSPNDPERFWTGRFAIASASGAITPPSEPTQPNGDDIPWGVGALADPSTARPPPPYLIGNSSVTSSRISTVRSSSSVAISSTRSVVVTPIGSATRTAGAESGTRSASASASASAVSAAASDLVVRGAVWHTLMALGVAASAAAFFF